MNGYVEHSALPKLAIEPSGPIKPATPEVLVARLAAARVEMEDGNSLMAAYRLSGEYDGDEQQRIALATIDILREQKMIVETVE